VTVTAPHASPSHSLGSGARPVETSSGLARRTLLLGLTIGRDVVSAAGVAAGDAPGDAVVDRDLRDESPHAESARIAAMDTRGSARRIEALMTQTHVFARFDQSNCTS